MNALSTHDTKRSEDVRATDHRAQRGGRPRDGDGEPVERERARRPDLDGGLSWLLWQALVGAIRSPPDRLQAFARKAASESKLRTSWLAPDEDVRGDGRRRDRGRAGRPERARLISRRSSASSDPRWSPTSWDSAHCSCCCPGCPTSTRAARRESLRLVDPDNRERPDWAGLGARLEAVLDQVPDPLVDLAGAKLRLTAQGLRLRRDSARASRRRLPARWSRSGVAAEHVVGFSRGDVAVTVTGSALALAAAGGWRDTIVGLPAGRWLDLLTGREHAVGPDGARVATSTAQWPVSVLRRRA